MPYYRTQKDLEFLRKKTAERDQVARPRVLYYVLLDAGETIDFMTRELTSSNPTLDEPIYLPAVISVTRGDPRQSEGGFKAAYRSTLKVSIQTLTNFGITPKPRDEVEFQGVRYRVSDAILDMSLPSTEHALEIKIPLLRIEREPNSDQPNLTSITEE